MAMSLKAMLPARFRSDTPVVPIVRLSGAIGAPPVSVPGCRLPASRRRSPRLFRSNARQPSRS